MNVELPPWRAQQDRNQTFVIAEAGVNHNGSLESALKLVDAAQSTGADAVKFQLFDADEQISHSAQTADYQNAATGAHSMIEMARTYDLTWDAHLQLADHCRDVGIEYMASCFDPRAIEFYRTVGGKILKIASGEITNVELLESAARTEMPVVLSTGMSSFTEIAAAVEHLESNSVTSLTLLHCVSEYPTPLHHLNLNYIYTLRTAFGLPVGLSDHTQHLGVGGWAVASGATVVEKHLTLDQSLPGPDHAMSCTPNQFATFVANIRDAELALGSYHKILTAEERQMRTSARRGIVAARDIGSGEELTRKDLAAKRPAEGLSPALMATIVGRRTTRKLVKDQLITWDDV